MYATAENGSNGYNVLAFNAAGAVQAVYSGDDYTAGNLSFGKIAFATNNQFFVASQDNLRRFTIGNPTGTVIYSNNQVFASTSLPSGNLLVLSAYQLQEITTAGTVVRTIAPGGGVSLVDARGVAYNPATGKIYVTMLGYTGEFDRILRLDGLSGLVEKDVTYGYADDLFLTRDNRLLVGSRTSNVGIFDLDLNQTGTLTSSPQMFVTQAVFNAVPEPGSVGLLSAAVLAGFGYRRSLRRRT
jgi:hypothetical protein